MLRESQLKGAGKGGAKCDPRVLSHGLKTVYHVAGLFNTMMFGGRICRQPVSVMNPDGW